MLDISSFPRLTPGCQCAVCGYVRRGEVELSTNLRDKVSVVLKIITDRQFEESANQATHPL